MTFDPRYQPQYPNPGAQYSQAPVYPSGVVPDYYGYPGGPGPAARAAGSGLGVASFIIGLVSGAILVISIVGVTMITVRAGGRMDPTSHEAIEAGFAIIFGMGAAVIGAILGIVNLTQTNRRKVFGLLGLIINAGIVLLVVAMMAIGHLKS